MRRKIILVFLALFLVMAAFQRLAAAGTYYLINPDLAGNYDVNKTGGDTNLCWAAAASNILAWDNWGTAGYTTGTSIFNNFKGNWTDAGGLAQYGWQWWFDGTNPKQGQAGWAQLTNTNSGKFYSGLTFTDYFLTTWAGYNSPTGNLMAVMDTDFHLGYGVALGLYKLDGSGHAVTAWGFDYSGQYGSHTYTALYMTDSDDNYTGMKSYGVTWNSSQGWWDLQGDYAGWHLADVEALKPNALAGASAVPLSNSLLLLSSGLLALAGWRRKFCHN